MSPSSPLRLAVFDCDGTLVDSQSSIVAAMQSAFAADGREPPTPEAVRRVVGLPLIDAMAHLAPGSDRDACARLTDHYRDAFWAQRRNGTVVEPLFPGTLDVLDELEAAGWLLGVATGKSYKGLIATLSGHGLENRFVTLQTSDRAAGKPSPDMLFRAMEETGADPATTVMVGDTTFDMLMARGADVLAVGVAWGYHDQDELRTAGAHAIIGDFAELPPVAAGLLGG